MATATKSAISLRQIESFGDVAAEDDAVLEYFLTTDAVTRIKNGDVFLVLGRKGAGKTALVRHFAEGNGKGVSRRLNLAGYPWSIHAQRVDHGSSEPSSLQRRGSSTPNCQRAWFLAAEAR